MNRFDRLLALLLEKADPELPEEKIGEAVNAAAGAAAKVVAEGLASGVTQCSSPRGAPGRIRGADSGSLGPGSRRPVRAPAGRCRVG